jgi:hypothetical protein
MKSLILFREDGRNTRAAPTVNFKTNPIFDLAANPRLNCLPGAKR